MKAGAEGSWARPSEIGLECDFERIAFYSNGMKTKALWLCIVKDTTRPEQIFQGSVHCRAQVLCHVAWLSD